MSPEMEMYGLQAPDNYFHIDDLLDFSNDDLFSTTTHESDHTPHHHLPPTTTTTTNPSSTNNISNNFINNNHNQNRIPNFSDDLCVPNDDVAELEWLSKFVDDSFSDFSMNDITGTTNFSRQQEEEPAANSSVVPGTKARSKRSRVASTHKTWISLPESSKQSHNNNNKIRSSEMMIISTSSSVSAAAAASGGHVIGNGDHHHHHQSSSTSSSSSSGGGGGGGGGRKCTHCASEKTPQWRTGPMGPKTLCNACGVRYKSGRLVPEYRPAASPTFVLTQHSNSHRKVMELRRQKEEEILTHDQHQHQDINNINNTHGFFRHPHHDFEVCRSTYTCPHIPSVRSSVHNLARVFHQLVLNHLH